MGNPSVVDFSEGTGLVHRLDARIKLAVLFAFVISIALLRHPSSVQLAAYLVLLLCIAAAAKLPLWRVLRSSLLVVPFVGLFSVLVYVSGDRVRAWDILAKSYLSAFSVLVTTSTTPMPQLLCAARFFRIPGFLVEVTGLTYRYLFVLRGEAQHMQTAFRARAGRPGRRALQASSGMIAVLFSKSYEKAGMVDQAMRARAYSGMPARCTYKRIE